MLRISIQETAEEVELKLEGRIAGPWAAELGRVWVETAPRLSSRKLVLDLSSVTLCKFGVRSLGSRTSNILAMPPTTQSAMNSRTNGKAKSGRNSIPDRTDSQRWTGRSAE